MPRRSRTDPEVDGRRQDPTYTPTYRASRSKLALDAYSARYEDHEADLQTIVADFLADLMHLADRTKLDLERALASAEHHHAEEVEEHAAGVR